MAASKFKPKASNNIIEGATPVEDTEVKDTPAVNETETKTPEDSVVDTSNQETTQETPTQDAPATEESSSVENKSEVETDTTPPTVTFEDKKSTTPIEKNVKICLKTKHSCVIGGVPYHFEKGKQYNVPNSVKSILLQADLLMPL